MSEKNKKILSYIISIASLVIAFLIIGRDAIFGDATLTDIDFTFFFVILVPIVLFNIILGVKTKNNDKDKK